MVYLQEKITKLTAKHLRDSTFDAGLASEDLLSHISTASSNSTENLNIVNEENMHSFMDVSEIKREIEPLD